MSGANVDDNLWQATAGPSIDATPLSGDVDADLVVIGGGFTGCSAALHAAEAGASVHVLEAERIGHGGSGRNAGLVNAGLWTPPDEVERILGKVPGRRLNSALADAPELVFTLIKEHDIACEAIRNGNLHCAHSVAGLSELELRYRQQRERGAPVELLSATETAAKTGASGLHGALLDHRAGTIQPLRYIHGLARAAKKAGASFHQHTPMLDFSRENDRWRVRTPSGSVTANNLILATNAYHRGATFAGAPKYTPLNFFQMATRPLDAAVRQGILPEQQGCWDTAVAMTAFRLDSAGRLIVGAIGSLGTPVASVHRAWARRKLRALFPAARDSPFEYNWSGRIAFSGDHLPKVVEFGPSAISIYGYSGRGIGPGTVFGKAAAAYTVSGKKDALPIAPHKVVRERLTSLKAAFYEASATLMHLVSNR